jgi:hypothetical protein
MQAFAAKQGVELVWNGKTSEVCNIVLPFQVIEQVDEPRVESPRPPLVKGGWGDQMPLFDTRGRQLKGWTNILIWCDNKLILSSLKNGPLSEEIEQQGGLKLIAIDPPFEESFEKFKPSSFKDLLDGFREYKGKIWQDSASEISCCAPKSQVSMAND